MQKAEAIIAALRDRLKDQGEVLAIAKRMIEDQEDKSKQLLETLDVLEGVTKSWKV